MAELSEKSPDYERQNTEDVADLPLKIPVSAIYEHFHCPICMSRIEEACVTPCGHRYCFKCIDECINRRHECPVCKEALNADQVVKDHGFDALMKVVREERSKAEKEYFQQLVDAATNAPFEHDHPMKVESPLQAVLQRHLKQSLALHESYHQGLILDYQRGLAKVGQEKNFLAQKAIRDFPHDPDHPERVAQLEEIERQWEAKRQSLGEELERVEKLLANAYDREEMSDHQLYHNAKGLYSTKYLTEHLPPPSTIPVNVQLSVPEKSFVVRDVLLRPEDSMAVILRKLKSFMEEQGMKIVEFPMCDEFEVSIISPFAPVSDDAGKASSSIYEADSEEPCEKEGPAMTLVDQVVHADCRPVLEFGMKPGTELRFKGKIMLEGDLPKLCFAATFVKGQNKSMDYFTCNKCGFNWVCRPCSESCHKGHELVPYVVNHKPTWACCYCPRKKMCGLQGTAE